MGLSKIVFIYWPLGEGGPAGIYKESLQFYRFQMFLLILLGFLTLPNLSSSDQTPAPCPGPCDQLGSMCGALTNCCCPPLTCSCTVPGTAEQYCCETASLPETNVNFDI